MSEDIVELSEDILARLRYCEGTYGLRAIIREAADEIERLRAELRTYTGDGHNTKGEPCTQNTPS